MGREHRILAALAGTPVPVPSVVGLSEGSSVNGAPFYVMQFVDGAILRDEASVEWVVSPDRRRAVANSLVDTLVSLHEIDPDAVGLGALGRKHGYVDRQLRRWRTQWDGVRTRDLPLVDEICRRLAARVPPQGPARIVHGDYRLDNVIVSPAGDVLAVLDWELCTLGDPLADVGLLVVYWTQRGDDFAALGAAPTSLPGFPTRDELTARYAAESGRDLSDLEFYVALGFWKLAVISEGVWSRYRSGAYQGRDEGFEGFRRVVEPLLEAAWEVVRRTGG
jgi:aminoglycoside phosphotransferase (APT) family kinase protein